MLQEEDYSVSRHENFFHRLTHYKHIINISLFKYLSFSLQTLVFSAILLRFLELVPSRTIRKAARKDSLTRKAEHSYLMNVAVELKNNHLPYSACTYNLPSVVIPGDKNKPSIFNYKINK